MGEIVEKHAHNLLDKENVRCDKRENSIKTFFCAVLGIPGCDYELP